MSKVRKDKASFKIGQYYFFMKKDDWGTYWHYNRFYIFRIIDGVVCEKNSYDDRYQPFPEPVQKVYQEWAVETILLGQ